VSDRFLVDVDAVAYRARDLLRDRRTTVGALAMSARVAAWPHGIE
jgi:hypothetical protein